MQINGLIHHKSISFFLAACLCWSLASNSRGNTALETLLASIDDAAMVDTQGLINKLRPHLSAANTAPPETQFHFYSLLAHGYGMEDDHQNAIRYWHTADMIAPESVFDTPEYAAHLIGWASSLFESQQLDDGKKLLQRSYQLHEKYGDPLVLLDTLVTHLAFSLAEDDWRQASELAQRSLELAFSEATVYPDDIARNDFQSTTLARCARLYHEYQYEKAIALYERALPLHQKIENKSGIEADLHYLVVLNIEAGNNNKAWRYIQQQLQFAKDNERPLGMLAAYTSSSRLHLLQNDLKLAERDILRAQVHMSKNSLPSLQQRYLLQKSRMLLQQNNAEAVITLLNPEIELFRHSNHMALRLRYYELLAQAYAMLEQPRQAFAAQREAMKLSMQWQQRETAHSQAIKNVRERESL
jgi:hypothetical protein